ncbi:AAA ATPase [Nitrosococcus oceani ATCC 19707]|uniref:AAA ATPase n=2 Tax=Nitrosococcus oceani TaxID=1229 RepID=Q3JA01_NITOC|nr:AAA family ATPase [Nitrosococcus oceani]ABA58345.1 AAA ATPase [Nitrosococcus oceani ATCC 19707]EDZ68322.1 ATPase, AAA family protein [Nitrosococcus oceani AFC27]KFI19274.1 ATPase AAA [Nitrosococcus oceani C-27]GEM18734.1 ATPase AAA [Nitrosococcus oceani]
MGFWKRRQKQRRDEPIQPLDEESFVEPEEELAEASLEETEEVGAFSKRAEAMPEESWKEEGIETTPDDPYLRDLLPALKRLDRLLEQAIAVAQTVYGPKAAANPFRGLHISKSEAEQLLTREPGRPVFHFPDKQLEETLSDEALGEGSRLAWLQQVFNLSSFELDVLLLALAPEIDLRYERLYAYLQDDVTRRRPSIDLVLNLLSLTTAEKLKNRIYFAPEAPLIQHNLVQLIPDSQQTSPSLLSHYLKIDEQIIRLLLGQENLDSRLAPCCEMVESNTSLDEAFFNTGIKQALPALILQAREAHRPLRLYFHGPHGIGKRRMAEALAAKVNRPLLIVDLLHALTVDPDFERVLKILFREAWFQNAVLYLEGMDTLLREERAIPYQALLDALAQDAGIVILAGTQPWVPRGRIPTGVIEVSFPIPDFAERRSCWQANLAAEDRALSSRDLDSLANRFRLTPNQIAEAAVTACNQALLRSITQAPEELPSQSRIQPTLSDLFAAARTQSGHELATLAKKIQPKYTWNDIVLPDDSMAQLREICQWVHHHHQVLGEWGFDRKLSLGKGVNALFSGPSGTGKTMAAEIMANKLALDLYKINLSTVISKYIGETEKNLERIFTAAENANAILFFDEADALFGKRSEVRDSHDRYANVEISYLLQKMETYEGIAILATNLRQNLDEAFVRRLAFTVHFPVPDEASRRRIWAGIWPIETPLAKEVDFDFLAQQFKLNGGNIKNIALAAAFLAAEKKGPVTMAHVLQAVRREYQKLGKPLSATELGIVAREASA